MSLCLRKKTKKFQEGKFKDIEFVIKTSRLIFVNYFAIFELQMGMIYQRHFVGLKLKRKWMMTTTLILTCEKSYLFFLQVPTYLNVLPCALLNECCSYRDDLNEI